MEPVFLLAVVIPALLGVLVLVIGRRGLTVRAIRRDVQRTNGR
jgi:hypothetical protein